MLSLSFLVLMLKLSWVSVSFKIHYLFFFLLSQKRRGLIPIFIRNRSSDH